MKANQYLLSSTLVAALGSLLFGFDTAVISGTTEALRQVFQLSSSQLGFTVASALVGTILGSLLAGKLAELLGRKRALTLLGIAYFVSSLGCGLAWSWASLLTFRFLGGIAIGVASVVAPMYIAEIAPPASRGRLVAVSQFNILLGILTAYFTNYIIALIFASPGADGVLAAWRWMFGIMAVPSLAYFFLALQIPESPRWLVNQRRPHEAVDILRRLGNQDAEQLIVEITESLHEEKVRTYE